jgi:thiosulfate/3-mercaptopyruvate sulfurtransferase
MFRQDLPRWQHLLAPAWLYQLQQGHEVLAAPAVNWRLLEVGCNDEPAYLHSHIPGAGYLDTALLEQPPLWNKLPDAQLLQSLLALGIRHDSTVILYGLKDIAAARAAHLMLYVGVRDVRLLDGGLLAWQRAGLPCVAGAAISYPPEQEFGAKFPGAAHYLTDLSQARQIQKQGSATLVSIRTREEFLGQTSGYSYIPAKGEIPGALWGQAGANGDVNSMSAYQSADGCMKSAASICRMWQQQGIAPGGSIVFYCGTGWRASLAFFYAWLMGWENISVFDGGWLEWSSEAQNPIRSV